MILQTALLAVVVGVSSGAFNGRMVGSNNVINKLQVDISEEEGAMYVALEGPSDMWFGLGFNATGMAGTYAVIVDGSGEVTERVLGDDSPGRSLDTAMFEMVHQQVMGGVRTVLLKRDLVGISSDYLTFSANNGTPFSLPVIVAVGTTPSLNYHGPNNRAGVTLDFSPATHVSTTPATTLVDFTLTAHTAVTAADMIELHMVGPQPFTIAFGTAGYQIVVKDDTAVEMFGSQVLESSIKVTNVAHNNISVIMTITRAMQGITEQHYSFSFGEVNVPYTVSAEGKAESGSAMLSTVRAVSGSVGGLPTSVSVVVDEGEDLVTIVMSGKIEDDDYLAVGFNASRMSDKPWTLIIVPDGNGSKIFEAHTFADSNGRGVLAAGHTPGIKVTNSSWENGVKTVTVTRPVRSSDVSSFNYGAGQLKIPIISATGQFVDGKVAYHKDQYESGSIALYPQGVYHGVIEHQYANGNITVSIDIDDVKDIVSIVMTGPSDKWFGAGFGSNEMNATYSILASHQVTENILNGPASSNTGPGPNMPSSLTIVNDAVSNGMRTVHVTRPVMYGPEHFIFRPTIFPKGMTTGMEVISAVGDKMDFGYHSTSRAGEGIVLSLNDEPPTPPTPTPPGTPSPSGQNGCTPSDLVMNVSVSTATYDCMATMTEGVTVHWTWDKETTVYLAVRSDMKPGWIGLTIANDAGLMIPAKGVIGVMHENGETDVQSYNVVKKAPTGIIADPTQELLGSGIEYVNGVGVLRFVRKLNNGGYPIDPQANTAFNYARSDHDQLTGHASNPGGRGSTTINFASGSNSKVTNPLKSKRLIHGWFMIVAWMWIVPGGVLVKRFGKEIAKGIWQFYTHIVLMMIAVVLTIAGYLVATQNNFGQGYSGHGSIGIVILVLACLNPVVGILGYVFVRDPMHPKRWIFRYVHLFVGRAVYLLAIIQVMFGIQSLYDLEDISRVDFYIPVFLGVGSFMACFAVAQVYVSKNTYVDVERGLLQSENESQ
eukprot:TRINITY_DN13741_c0_g5_i2.p1 TRINITY_DN13741_c0_g5~~TRINITY_DN13741_c0_g5_i2.p1  ORF type:complete len:993 (+),score=256.68 TRINITY_DN13741_c0_g5_i2:73-3051(+)